MTPGQVVKLDVSNALSPTILTSPGMVLTAAVLDIPDGVVVQDTPASAQGTIQTMGGSFITVYQDSGSNIAVAAIVGPSAAVAGAVTTTTTAPDGVVGKAWSAGTATGDPIGVRLILDVY